MIKTKLIAILAGLAVAVAGCNLLSPIDNPNRSSREVVLTGFLSPGAPVEVTIRSTIPLAEYYPWRPLDPYALSDAIVLVTSNGADYVLTEDAQRPGVYAHSTLVADTVTAYAIDITFPSGHAFENRHLTASTLVPGQVALDVQLTASQIAKGGALDNLLFPKELANRDRFGITSALTPARASWSNATEAANFIIGAIAQDTLGTGLLRQWEWDMWLDGDLNDPQQREWMERSGFVTLPDSLAGDIFWALFDYAGPNDLIVFATDVGYGDYFRTVTQGAGNSGADADRGPKINITGGLGVFGSYTADTIEVNVVPEWLPSDHVPAN